MLRVVAHYLYKKTTQLLLLNKLHCLFWFSDNSGLGAGSGVFGVFGLGVWVRDGCCWVREVLGVADRLFVLGEGWKIYYICVLVVANVRVIWSKKTSFMINKNFHTGATFFKFKHIINYIPLCILKWKLTVNVNLQSS